MPELAPTTEKGYPMLRRSLKMLFFLKVRQPSPLFIRGCNLPFIMVPIHDCFFFSFVLQIENCRLDDPSYRRTLFVFWPPLYCHERYQIHIYTSELIPRFYCNAVLYEYLTVHVCTWSMVMCVSLLYVTLFIATTAITLPRLLLAQYVAHLLANEYQLVTSLTSQM